MLTGVLQSVVSVGSRYSTTTSAAVSPRPKPDRSRTPSGMSSPRWCCTFGARRGLVDDRDPGGVSGRVGDGVVGVDQPARHRRSRRSAEAGSGMTRANSTSAWPRRGLGCLLMAYSTMTSPAHSQGERFCVVAHEVPAYERLADDVLGRVRRIRVPVSPSPSTVVGSRAAEARARPRPVRGARGGGREVRHDAPGRDVGVPSARSFRPPEP